MNNKEMQKRLIYIVLVTGLVWVYVSYMPFLMDYYVCRPDMPFGWFYEQNLTNVVYEFESVLLALTAVFVFCLTWNGGASIGIVSLAAFVLTHGSYVKYMNRKEMLRLDDFRLTEAAGMAAGYFKFEFDRYLLVFVGNLLLFGLMGAGLEYVRRNRLFPNNKEAKEIAKDRKELFRIIAARVLTAGFVGFMMVFYTTRFMVSYAGYDSAYMLSPVKTDADRYVLYRFVENERLVYVDAEQTQLSYDFLLGEADVEDVFAENVVVETVSDGDAVVRPNIIVIMNESWWNTDNIDPKKVSFSKDPMAAYKRLSDECVTGHLTSNVYGGGTISSEAEFLTGINTKYYVTSSTIYEMTKDRKLPSVVDYFNALDYETVAIHPYYGDFYNRDEVYQTMGFDETIFEEDMQNREIYSRYISDESLVKEIIAEYEEQGEEENKFIWSVSVSNHRRSLAYHIDSVENYDYPIEIELKDGELSEEDNEILVNYINGIWYAGQAYEELVAYFSEKEEPVIIVMYGDHVPNFSVETRAALGLGSKELGYENRDSEDFFDEIFWEDVEENVIYEGEVWEDFGAAKGESFEMLEKLYSVPVIMWSNFELEEEPIFAGESIYYLPQMLLESADMPECEMTRMLRYQRGVFRANAREFVLDEDGKQLLTCSDEQLEVLNHSKTVIYDILFGEEIRDNVWVPD